MGILDRIKAHVAFTKEFYGLDYWDDRSLIEGYVEASRELTSLFDDKFQHSNGVVRAAAGAGFGVVRLLGAIPVSLNQWGLEVIDAIPEGLGETVYTLVAVPASGIVNAIDHVENTMVAWANGSLNEVDPFYIANEVTGILGTAGIMVFGAKGFIEGGMKAVDCALGGELSISALGETATASVAVDGAAVASGLGTMGRGLILMSSQGDGLASRSGSSRSRDSYKKGPINVKVKIWKKTFGRFPEPWDKRAAWGVGIGGGPQ